MKRNSLLVNGLLAIMILAGGFLFSADNNDTGAKRRKAATLEGQGNYKDALEVYQDLIFKTQDNKDFVQNDIDHAVMCLNNINRSDEIDTFIEKAIAQHKENWRVLQRCAVIYQNQQHYGFMISGEFKRGGHRGGGKVVNSQERDRVRALQLLDQSIPLASSAEKAEKFELYQQYMRFLVSYRGMNESWRLQYLTDLSVLPDYEEGYGWYRGGGETKGAPVDADGKAVFHKIPDSFKEAATDGERWRWLMEECKKVCSERKYEIMYGFADFLQQQFDVQTMAYYGNSERGSDTEKDESGPYATITLKENETIARLANGIKRFTVPDEFSFIAIYRQIAEDNKDKTYAEASWQKLSEIFSNRRQYPKAA